MFVFLLLTIAASIYVPIRPIPRHSEVEITGMEMISEGFKDEVGEVPELSTSLITRIVNMYNTNYYSAVFVGNHAKKHTALIDTGSTFLWLPSIGCASCHKIAHKYDFRKSSSYKDLKLSITMRHDKYIVKGTGSSETVGMYNNNSTIYANNTFFLLVEGESGTKYMVTDGVLGLAFSPRGNSKLNGFVDQLKNQEKIRYALFSLYFDDNILGDSVAVVPQSNIILGGFSMYFSQEKRLNIIRTYKNSGHWISPLHSIKINNNTIKATAKYAHFNSGNHLLQGPRSDIQKMFKEITEGSYCYNVNHYNFCYCKEYANYPIFTFKIDRKEFALGPEHYLAQASGWCMILLEPLDNTSLFTLGLPFLRKYYTVYNMENGLMGVSLARKSVPVKPSNQ